jgi:hypothetical protein
VAAPDGREVAFAVWGDPTGSPVLIWMWTVDDAVDIVVERETAPWTTQRRGFLRRAKPRGNPLVWPAFRNDP